MAREEELYEKTNDELREILEDYDESTSGNKDELVERIVHFELGVPETDESDVADTDESQAEETDSSDETAAQDADAADTPPEDDENDVGPTDESAEDEGDLVLVKFLGGSALHQTHGHTFSHEHPFGALTEDKAADLVQKKVGLFRYATASEAERYYS